MNEFLRGLSEQFPDDYIVLVMDNAVWHKYKSLVIPHNIEFAFIPPYTPEMYPIGQRFENVDSRTKCLQLLMMLLIDCKK